ncbi:MAG: geranylgeranyl reductase family protein [Propionibacterium sp.]|nr:geranylgeranyl reductase family protein [Propionibacterium sp.]
MSVGTDVDVIVVGAGPGGASAARELAADGVDVLLLEREIFPRYKTCGGGIIGVTRACVPAGAPIREQIYEASFSLRGARFRTQRSNTPFMSTVSRIEFDSWLVDLAKTAGATFRDGCGVRSVEQDSRCVRVRASNGEILTSRFLIDASGTSSRIAKQIGVKLRTIDLGLELELKDNPESSEWRQRIHLDWGKIPGSYAWVFPKKDSLTVGVIARKGTPDQTRHYLADFSKRVGLDSRAVLGTSGHLTRCRDHRSPLGDGRILLVGDAAGLLEPWTREGLSFATRSGSLSGRIISQALREDARGGAALQLYQDQLAGTLIAEMRAGFRALSAFERLPEAFHLLMAHTSPGWEYFTRITTGDTNLARATRHSSVRIALGLMERLPTRSSGL